MSTTTDDLRDAIRSAHAAAAPATVAIGRRGRGSGVVVAPGRVLTNAHNLRDRTTQVTFADGTATQGTVLGTDLDHDVVVLEVDTGDVTPVAWADEPPALGDTVFAVSRGHRGDRVTAGQVSAVDRAFRGPRGRRVKGAVEHTAPLARGASGGPVVDAAGRLLGLNTHRLGEGFYLAQPVDADLRTRVDALVAGTSIRTRRLGISIVPGPAAARLRRQVGLPDRPGLLVGGVVPGSPADAAGIDQGDLVVAADGTEVADVDGLWDVLDAAGDEVVLRVVRGTDERDVPVAFTAPGSDEGPDGA